MVVIFALGSKSGYFSTWGEKHRLWNQIGSILSP